jgi:hypothetical protein
MRNRETRKPFDFDQVREALRIPDPRFRIPDPDLDRIPIRTAIKRILNAP